MSSSKISSSVTVVKEGELQIYERKDVGCCRRCCCCCWCDGGPKWRKQYFVLTDDVVLRWHESKDDPQVKGSIHLKYLAKYIAIGLVTDQMPVRKPPLPAGCSKHLLVGIGLNAQATKVYWILFSNAAELEAWFKEIAKLLPAPGQAAPPLGVHQPATNPDYRGTPTSGAPPPHQPPPPSQGTQPQPPNMAQPPMYPRLNQAPPNYSPRPAYPVQQGGAPFPAQAPHHTVVVQQPGVVYNNEERVISGLLLGSMLGYGLGACWGPPVCYGYGLGGFGMPIGGFYGGGYYGGGFGGGYFSDNDTNIVNNYYGAETTAAAAAGAPVAAEAGVAQDAGLFQPDAAADYGGGYFGGADFGPAFDAGNYDGGAADFGGGDFGGGDFGGGRLRFAPPLQAEI